MSRARPASGSALPISRRGVLAAGIAGCCLAASPFLTPLTLAAAPGDRRLVVITLRGGMDGLDVLRPVGDPDFTGLRPTLGQAAGAVPLDGFFALHPGLAGLMPLWTEGSLGFAHAVSTPYRDKRSHFEGQDLLEAGLPALAHPGTPDTGWMNRLAGLLPGVGPRTAFSVGREGELILKGPAPATEWYPQNRLGLSSQGERLFRLIYEDDPLFDRSAGQAFALLAEAGSGSGAGAGAVDTSQPPHLVLADYLAQQLTGETRLAAFSINGWDSHGQQEASLKKPLEMLSGTLVRLRERLGPVWEQTAILAMTEFGRSVHENGTGGTDHGTGGAMLLAGGAVRGGKVHGQWPGLAEAQLYDRRDLMPTADVRAYAASAIAALFGVGRSDLERTVFPGLDLAEPPQIIA